MFRTDPYSIYERSILKIGPNNTNNRQYTTCFLFYSKILASDGAVEAVGNTTHSDTASVSIVIHDSNDNKPAFTAGNIASGYVFS